MVIRSTGEGGVMVRRAIETSIAIGGRLFAPEAASTGPVRDFALRMLPVVSIRPNPRQPRRIFDDAGLRRLAESLQTHGTLQPISVRSVAGGYELIAGERRWRAAKLAGLSEIPAIVREVALDQLLELSLVENLHRQDLNPIEKARAYRMLHVEQELSHEEIGRRMGEDRKTIGNTIRLLRLDQVAQ